VIAYLEKELSLNRSLAPLNQGCINQLRHRGYDLLGGVGQVPRAGLGNQMIKCEGSPGFRVP